MLKQQCWLAGFFVFAGMVFTSRLAISEQPPNMVVVLVDDHAFEAISAYGTYFKLKGHPAELFDRKTDPNQLFNVAGNTESKSVIATLESELQNQIQKVEISPGELPGSGSKSKKKKIEAKHLAGSQRAHQGSSIAASPRCFSGAQWRRSIDRSTVPLANATSGSRNPYGLHVSGTRSPGRRRRSLVWSDPN